MIEAATSRVPPVTSSQPLPEPNMTPPTTTMYSAATMPPTITDPNPHQSTRRVPHAEVAYSTRRIAKSVGSGPNPASICTTAPAQAAASARPGARRPIATPPNRNTDDEIRPMTLTAEDPATSGWGA